MTPRERARAAGKQWAISHHYTDGDMPDAIADEFADDVKLAELAREYARLWYDNMPCGDEHLALRTEARRQLAAAAPVTVTSVTYRKQGRAIRHEVTNAEGLEIATLLRLEIDSAPAKPEDAVLTKEQAIKPDVVVDPEVKP